MKKLPVILSLLSTSLLGSSATNSMEDKLAGGSGASSGKVSEFRADFEAMRLSKEAFEMPSSSSPLSRSSSVPVGRSAFYDEVLKVGTRHQHAKFLSEQDEFDRALEMSKREAQIEEETRIALEESEALVLANLKKKEIDDLEDQIETLEAFKKSQFENQSTMSDSLIQSIQKKYGYEATDTEESRAAASVEYDRIDKELEESRAHNTLIWKELSNLRDKLRELQYGRSFVIPVAFPVASSEDLPIGIGGPGGPTGFEGGLPLIHSSALPVSSVVSTDTGVDKL